jgi:hypothetical protein
LIGGESWCGKGQKEGESAEGFSHRAGSLAFARRASNETPVGEAERLSCWR